MARTTAPAEAEAEAMTGAHKVTVFDEPGQILADDGRRVDGRPRLFLPWRSVAIILILIAGAAAAALALATPTADLAWAENPSTERLLLAAAGVGALGLLAGLGLASPGARSLGEWRAAASATRPVRRRPGGAFVGDAVARPGAQSRVEEATELLQGSLDALDAEVALLDENGRVVAVNEAWRDAAAGRKLLQPGLGELYLELCRKIIPELNGAKVARGLRDLLAGRRRSFAMAYVLTAAEGVRWRRLRINRFQSGHALRLIAVHEDVTEVARAQAALRETSERLLTIQDEERQRIALELHDSTSQHLVALGLGVTRLRRACDGGDAGAILDDMSGSVAEALKEIRVFSFLLSPPNLERDGLEVTARRFISGFGARAGLRTEFRPQGDLGSLELVIQRAAYRVIQEALSNVHRHAAANNATIDLTQRGAELILRICDDGRGIDNWELGPETTSEFGAETGIQLGVGIPGMRARLAQLGGSFRISGSRAGTVVEAIFRLPQAPAARRRAARAA